MKMDVGPGNINVLKGISVLKNYISDRDFKLDPLGLKKYEHNYDAFINDLRSMSSDLTLKSPALYCGKMIFNCGQGGITVEMREGCICLRLVLLRRTEY